MPFFCAFCAFSRRRSFPHLSRQMAPVPFYAGGWINASLSPTRTNRVTMWTRGPTTKTCSRTETPPHAARPEWQKARAHRRDRLGPGSDGACSRPISSRPAYPSCQNAVPQGQDRQRNGKYYRLNSRHPPANIAPCLVRLKNQFSLTRAALSTCGSAKSNFLSVAWGRRRQTWLSPESSKLRAECSA